MTGVPAQGDAREHPSTPRPQASPHTAPPTAAWRHVQGVPLHTKTPPGAGAHCTNEETLREARSQGTVSGRQGVICIQVHLTLLPASSLSGREDGHRAAGFMGGKLGP